MDGLNKKQLLKIHDGFQEKPHAVWLLPALAPPPCFCLTVNEREVRDAEHGRRKVLCWQASPLVMSQGEVIGLSEAFRLKLRKELCAQ